MGGPGSGRKKGGGKNKSDNMIKIQNTGSYGKKSRSSKKNVDKISEYNNKVRKSGKIGGK